MHQKIREWRLQMACWNLHLNLQVTHSILKKQKVGPKAGKKSFMVFEIFQRQNTDWMHCSFTMKHKNIVCCMPDKVLYLFGKVYRISLGTENLAGHRSFDLFIWRCQGLSPGLFALKSTFWITCRKLQVLAFMGWHYHRGFTNHQRFSICINK